MPASRTVALVAALLPVSVGVAPAGAVPVPVATPAHDRRAPLSLVVDGIQRIANIVALLRDSDVLVTRDDLRAAGVPTPGARLIAIDGVSYVSLASLAPHVTFRIDESGIALDLQIESALLAHDRLDIAPAPDAARAKADPSGFLTYSLATGSGDGGYGNAYVQAGGGSAASGLFTASAAYEDGAARRGLFTYQRDSEAKLSRFTVGDDFASTGELGANVVVDGVGASRHFEFQPDYAYFPTPGLSGTALSPTTADLYVNGTYLRSVQLPPGTFDLSGIPVPQGAGVTQVVLHDAYGNSQSITGAYYQARSLLRRGLTDYDYHVGFLRTDPFGSQDSEGPFAALGEYRIGVTDGLTLGGRFERTAGIESGGPQVDVALPVGHVSLESALSDDFGRSGNALAAAYEYYGRRFGVSVSAQTQSANYATASLGAYALRERSNVREAFALPLSHSATFDISNTTTTFGGLPAAGMLLAELNVRPSRRDLYVTFSAARNTGGSIFGLGNAAAPPHWTFGALATLGTGKTSSVSVGSQAGADDASSTVQITKPAPLGPGFGFQLQSTAGSVERFSAAQVAYQSQYGELEALSTSGLGPDSTSLRLSGALVGFPQGVFFTQPVDGAYALVDVPQFARLPVFFDNLYAGRTDGRDAMVVPYLSPYYENRISIDELRDRLDLSEDSSSNDVRPKTLSGAVTRFTIRHFHAYAGHIVLRAAGRTIVPALGHVVFTRDGVDYASDLGLEGQFYAEDLRAGRFSATVTTSEGRACTFAIEFPDDSKPVTSVGTVTCEVRS
jgi:outer membrane usher protein